jgi:hypothetical protein
MPSPTYEVTAEDVFARYKLKEPSEARLAVMTQMLAGIVAVIDETTVDWPDDEDEWPARQAATEEAIRLMAHRVWARGGSPEGAAGFGRDQSLIRVARTDPDVEFFLHPWSLGDLPV